MYKTIKSKKKKYVWFSQENENDYVLCNWIWAFFVGFSIVFLIETFNLMALRADFTDILAGFFMTALLQITPFLVFNGSDVIAHDRLQRVEARLGIKIER